MVRRPAVAEGLLRAVLSSAGERSRGCYCLRNRATGRGSMRTSHGETLALSKAVQGVASTATNSKAISKEEGTTVARDIASSAERGSSVAKELLP